MKDLLFTPEAQNFLDRIEDLRSQIIHLISDLPAEGLNWRPVEGEGDHATNSLAALASHTIGAEQLWIHEVIGRRPSTRDRDAELGIKVDSPEPILQRIEQVGKQTRKVFNEFTATTLDEPRQVEDEIVAVRWGILHVVDHTALHLGHMQVTYQLWNLGKAYDSPRWFQRIKKK